MNPTPDPSKLCGAKCRRTGEPCKAPSMPNGRCRMHGGKSTGPRTPEGLERCRKARWKHGKRSRIVLAERSQSKATARATWDVLTIAPRLRQYEEELKVERARLVEEREALRLAWEEIERERGGERGTTPTTMQARAPVDRSGRCR